MKYFKSVCACALAALSVGCSTTESWECDSYDYSSSVSLGYTLPLEQTVDASQFIEAKTAYLNELMSDPAFIRVQPLTSSISLYHELDYETNEKIETESFGAYIYTSYDGTPEAATLLLQSEGYMSIDISQCHPNENNK